MIMIQHLLGKNQAVKSQHIIEFVSSRPENFVNFQPISTNEVSKSVTIDYEKDIDKETSER